MWVASGVFYTIHAYRGWFRIMVWRIILTGVTGRLFNIRIRAHLHIRVNMEHSRDGTMKPKPRRCWAMSTWTWWRCPVNPQIKLQKFIHVNCLPVGFVFPIPAILTFYHPFDPFTVFLAIILLFLWGYELFHFVNPILSWETFRWG